MVNIYYIFIEKISYKFDERMGVVVGWKKSKMSAVCVRIAKMRLKP